jgi:hypothetical protein
MLKKVFLISVFSFSMPPFCSQSPQPPVSVQQSLLPESQTRLTETGEHLTGRQYLNFVIAALGAELIPDNDYLAQAAVAFSIKSPHPHVESICLSLTSGHRIYRLHSSNPAKNGLIKNTTEKSILFNFFKRKKGEYVKYKIPMSGLNLNSAEVNHEAVVFAKFKDNVCFAQFRVVETDHKDKKYTAIETNIANLNPAGNLQSNAHMAVDEVAFGNKEDVYSANGHLIIPTQPIVAAGTVPSQPVVSTTTPVPIVVPF